MYVYMLCYVFNMCFCFFLRGLHVQLELELEGGDAVGLRPAGHLALLHLLRACQTLCGDLASVSPTNDSNKTLNFTKQT